jgi:hypothetical protein
MKLKSCLLATALIFRATQVSALPVSKGLNESEYSSPKSLYSTALTQSPESTTSNAHVTSSAHLLPILPTSSTVSVLSGVSTSAAVNFTNLNDSMDAMDALNDVHETSASDQGHEDNSGNFDSIDNLENSDDSLLSELSDSAIEVDFSNSTAFDINEKRLRRSHFVTDPDWQDVTVGNLDPRATMTCGRPPH